MQFPIILTICALAGLSFALPTSDSFPREWQDCPAQTSFYVCASNGFRGCCSVDPCALPNCPGASSSPADPVPKRPLVCEPGKHQVWKPTMFNLDLSMPNLVSTASKDISLSQAPSSTKQQLVVFPAIPVTAKECSLNWGVPATREFTVTPSGLVNVIALDSPLPAAISVASLRGAKGSRVGRADFTNWPQVTGAHNHTVSSLGCKEVVALITGIDTEIDPATTGNVQLVQAADAGWYLDYTC